MDSIPISNTDLSNALLLLMLPSRTHPLLPRSLSTRCVVKTFPYLDRGISATVTHILIVSFQFHSLVVKVKVKVKVWTLAIAPLRVYMSQTRDQQRFTISVVAADWHEPMVPQRIMWPSIARANGQLDPRCS